MLVDGGDADGGGEAPRRGGRGETSLRLRRGRPTLEPTETNDRPRRRPFPDLRPSRRPRTRYKAARCAGRGRVREGGVSSRRRAERTARYEPPVRLSVVRRGRGRVRRRGDRGRRGLESLGVGSCGGRGDAGDVRRRTRGTWTSGRVAEGSDQTFLVWAAERSDFGVERDGRMIGRLEPHRLILVRHSEFSSMRLEMEKWAMRRTRRTRLVVTIPRANYLAKTARSAAVCPYRVLRVHSPKKWWLHLISACSSPDRRGAAHAT